MTDSIHGNTSAEDAAVLAVLKYRIEQAEMALKGFTEGLNEAKDEFSLGIREVNTSINNMTRAFAEAQVCEKRVEKIETKLGEVEEKVDAHEALVTILGKFVDVLSHKTTKKLVIVVVCGWLASKPDYAWLKDHVKALLEAAGG